MFLTLTVFSGTGGIEKVCKIVGKALFENSLTSRIKVKLFSMYDKTGNANENQYFPSEQFYGFNIRKLKFFIWAFREGLRSEVILMSHINLLVVGWMVKKVSPKTQIVLFAHGIEVWNKLPAFRKRMLRDCDKILAVSKYTADIILDLHQVAPGKIQVLNNCLNPYLPIQARKSDPKVLREKYQFSADDQVLFTLTRLSSRERYKGYDKVIESMVRLTPYFPKLKYLIAGSYDAAEKIYLDNMIAKFGLEDRVKMAGFIPDEALEDYFGMADLYVMPSIKEGFGIVFIEAMFYGLPAIAGNRDGSVDALLNGKLGLLVDPLNVEEISEAISRVLKEPSRFVPDRKLLLSTFGYDNYKNNLLKELSQVE